MPGLILGLFKGGNDSDTDVEQHQLVQRITNSTVLDISSSNQSDKTQLDPIENLDALEGSLDHESTPSDVSETPINEELAPAESSATLFDPQSCSPSEKKHLRTGLENIGDEVVLQCILQGMADDCGGLSGPTELFHTPQDNGSVASSDSGSAGFSTPLLGKALPELRLRKDPPYQLPPSIAITEATPTEMDRKQVCHLRGYSPPLFQESPGSRVRSPSTGSMIPYHCNRYVEPGGLCSFMTCRSTGQLAHGEMIPKVLVPQQDSGIEQYNISEEHHSSRFAFSSLIRATAGRLQAVFGRKHPKFASPELPV
jgi:hypothetical protein